MGWCNQLPSDSTPKYWVYCSVKYKHYLAVMQCPCSVMNLLDGFKWAQRLVFALVRHGAWHTVVQIGISSPAALTSNPKCCTVSDTWPSSRETVTQRKEWWSIRCMNSDFLSTLCLLNKEALNLNLSYRLVRNTLHILTEHKISILTVNLKYFHLNGMNEWLFIACLYIFRQSRARTGK